MSRHEKLSLENLQRLDEETFATTPKHPIIAVLENVRSGYNTGAFFRTGDAFAIEAIYLIGYTPVPPHKEIRKTALGAENTVTWKHFKTTAETLEALRADGFAVYAVEQATGSESLKTFTPTGKTAVVFGNEVTGVEQTTIDACDGCIEIPQWGTKHSLNVSVAGGVILWELVRKLSGA